jgi:hypothetical protein
MDFSKLIDKVLREQEEETSYRGQHIAPGPDSAAAYDLTMNDVYPKDVYVRPDWYEGDSEGLTELRKIIRLKNRPDAPVWIFRAIPKKVKHPIYSKNIKVGDWVTTNKKYARDHAEGHLNDEYEIISWRVKARDIFTNGDSIFEWGFYPQV